MCVCVIPSEERRSAQWGGGGGVRGILQSKKVPIMGLSIWSTWYEFRIEVWSRQGLNVWRLDVPHTHNPFGWVLGTVDLTIFLSESGSSPDGSHKKSKDESSAPGLRKEAAETSNKVYVANRWDRLSAVHYCETPLLLLNARTVQKDGLYLFWGPT